MLLTIITVCRNSASTLDQTISSVLTQSHQNFEYIIIDGASSDNSVEIIQSHTDPRITWVSEPDKGIANAMNKGINLAHGDWLLFLHADDYLTDSNVLELVSHYLTDDVDIVGMPVLYTHSNKQRLLRSGGFNWWINFKTRFAHQGTFIRKSLFDKLGLYDEAFRIAMDYEFFLRAYRARTPIAVYDDFPIAVMRDTGISSRNDWPTLSKRFSEERAAQKKHVQSRSQQYLYLIYWAIYLPYRRLKKVFQT